MKMESLNRCKRQIGFFTLALAAAGLSGSALAQTSVTTAASQTPITKTLGSATGLAVDALGNLYAADGANNLLVSLQGSNGAPATVLSSLSTPGQLAIDNSRNLYIANGTSKQVEELQYSAGSFNLNSPVKLGSGLGTVTGVAVDLSGNVYIVDATNKQVVKITGTTQTVLTTALTAPTQIAVDRSGNVYIADAGANSVVMLPVGGGVAVPVGSGLSAPAGVVTDASGDLFIADTGNNRVVEVPATAGVPVTANQIVPIPAITSPTSLAMDTRGTVYVTSQGSIYRYTSGSIYFGLLPVGTTSQTFPVTLTFTAGAVPATIKVLTTGIVGLDYKDAGSDTCTATTYASGNTCTMNVTFTPGAVGPRYGAIVLYDVNNKVLSRTFLGGGGIGALLNTDPGTLTTITPTATITTPRGITTDAAGDVFLAEYGGGRILEIPAGSTTPVVLATLGSNGVAINGAGDLIIGSGSTNLTVLPYENGTYSTADETVLGTTYSKARIARTDVGGNIFLCDNGVNKVYEFPAGSTTSVTLGMTAYSTACLGIAVDLYGNIALADSSAGKLLYAPVNGATPYETGSGYGSAWGVAFDPSGSVWESSSSVNQLGRIPNEYGTMVGADQTLSTVDNIKNFDIWVDPTGNIYSTTATGTTILTYNMVNRSTTPLTFTATAIGATNATTLTAILSSSGNVAPTYTNNGMVDLYDIDDFVSKTPASPICSFTSGLQPGFTCNLGFGYAPLSVGPRTETVALSSNAISNPSIVLTGTTTGTVSGTATLALSLTTPASGSPAPGQALVVTGAATPSATTAATGSLTFYIDGKVNATVELAANKALFSIPAGLAAGTHSITSTYSGDKNYNPVTTAASVSITVVQATSTVTLVSSGNEVAVNQSVTFTATIPTQSGLAVPTGTVIFKDTSTSTTVGTGTVNGSGVASVSTSTLASGTHSITATYSGDSVYTGSSSTAVSVTVGNFTLSSTTLTVTPTQPTGGYSYGTALSAHVVVAPQTGTGTPTGNVIFSLDGTPTSAALSSGAVTLPLTSIPAGTHVLTASYQGDSTYASSASNSFSFTVVKAVTATTLSTSSTSNYASISVTLTATVSSTTSTPGGSVNFYNGLTLLGTSALSSGVATLSTTALPAGSDSITASYAGDANDTASTSAPVAIAVTIVPSTMTLSAAPSVILTGSTATLTATLTGTITAGFSGTVTFSSGGTVLGTGPVSSSGIATFTTAALTASITSFTASYGGSAVFAASSSAAPAYVYVTDPNGAGVVVAATLGSGFSSTAGVAVDISGNVYIADSTKGSVSLVAGGAGAQSTVASSLTSPASVAVDGLGDLFIANGTSKGVTEILSQNGALVASTTTQLGSSLGTLSGVAVDAAGNVYVADSTNKQLVKISGTTQTVLATGLINPQQVAVDYLGDVYVADGTGNRVFSYTAAGVAGTVGSGLLNPTGVAVDSTGNIYISDTGNNRVVKVPATAGVPSTSAPAVLIATITAPGQLAVDRHQALYIGTGTSIYKWQSMAASFGVLAPGGKTPTYTLTYTFASAITPGTIKVLTYGVTGGEYKDAGGSTCVAGTAYATGQSCTINVSFSPTAAGVRPGAVVFAAATGQPLLTTYLGGVGFAPVLNVDDGVTTGLTVNGTGLIAGTAIGSETRGIVADSVGNLYVCDASNGRIVQTTTTGATGSVLYNVSCGSIALDGSGNLLIDDMGNSRVVLLPNENGTINANDMYVVATGFSAPRGMGLDGFGDVYVADSTNIRVVAQPIGGATTTQTVMPFTNLKSVYDVAVDWQGNIAAIDSTQAAIEYLPATGKGQTQLPTIFCAPYALAMDPGGAIYVSDYSAPSGTTCATATTPGKDVVRITPNSTSVEYPIGHISNAQSVYVDPQGNLYVGGSVTVTTGGAVTVAGSPTIVNRNLGAVLTATSSAVGSTSAAVTAILVNDGPAPATFANPAGQSYYDGADFALATGSPACSFTTTFAAEASCGIAFTFTPLQSGTRTAEYAPLSNSTTTPLIQLSGVATGGTTTGTSVSLKITVPANGKPSPNTAMTIVATVTGSGTTPTGSVTLLIDGVLIGTEAVATPTFALTNGVTPGFHVATVIYSGDANNTTSTGTLSFSAAGTTTSTSALTVSAASQTQGQSETITATVTGTAGGATPTGVFLFYDGGTVIGTVAVGSNGSASLTTTTLALGTHTLTAGYAGDGTYATSVTPAVTVTIIYPGDYVITAPTTPLTIAVGQTGALTFTVTPLASPQGAYYNGTVGLSCSGLPVYTTCAFYPNSATLGGTSSAVTGTLTIITETQFAQLNLSDPAAVIRLCALPAGVLVLLVGMGSFSRGRKALRTLTARRALLLMLAAISLSAMSACGSHAPLASPSGTYTLTISGTGTGNVNHTVTTQIVLQQ